MSRSAQRSAAQWAELIHAYRASGESERVFCQRHGLVLRTFRKWKYRHRASALPPELPRQSGFVEVVSSPPRDNDANGTRVGEPIRICLGGEVSIECPAGMTLSTIVRLARALADGC